MVCEAKIGLKKEADQSNPSGKIKARVTTWGPRDGADGRKFNYQPEGFQEWANEFAKEGKPMPMFLNHNDMGMPVGEWSNFEFDSTGMSAEGKLFLNTVGGSDLYNILKESPNLFGGVSVGAYADEAQWVKQDGTPYEMGPNGDIYSNPDFDWDEAYFQITKGGLREVSVVMYPNNPNAEITKLEYFTEEGQIDLRVLEKSLRDAGISKHGAVTAASVFKKVLEQRDAVKAPIETAPNQSDSDAEVTEQILKAFELRELSKKLDSILKG